MITRDEILKLEGWELYMGFLLKDREVELRIYHDLPPCTVIRLTGYDQQLFVGRVKDVEEFKKLCSMIGI